MEKLMSYFSPFRSEKNKIFHRIKLWGKLSVMIDHLINQQLIFSKISKIKLIL